MGFINKRLGLFIVLLCIVNISYSQIFILGDVDAGDDVTLDCTSGPCTTLSADFLESHVTNARYTVESIPFAGVPVSTDSTIDEDDEFSPVITLPFQFCYFGNVSDQIVIGDNGNLSFDTSLAGQFNPWQFTASVPSPALPSGGIFGAYHDIDVEPARGGSGEITYGVIGTAPFRAFIISYRSCTLYGCYDDVTTQQIVLHETSNYIDVYITEKPNACGGAANPRAVIGIQNIGGTEGYAAPGRNTGEWSATNEAWRFAPEISGDITYQFEWINETTGMVESTDPDYEVCPTETTEYTAHVTWINCVGNTVEDEDSVIVTVDLPFTLAIDGGDQDFCVGDPAYTINTTTTTTGGVTITGYNWYEAADPSTSLGTGDSLTVSTTGTYVVEVTDSGGCTLQQEVDITYNPVPDAGTNGTIDFCSTDASADLFASLGGTPDTGGTWSPALTSGTGVFDPSVDTAGTYTYTLDGNGCPDATAEVVVTITTAPNAGTNNTIDFCSTDTSADLFASLGGTPDAGGTWSPALTSGTGVFDPSVDAAGVYTYTVLAAGNCTTDATATITVGIDTAPDAGTNGAINFCSTDASADLFASLGGTPDTGGTWSPALTSGTGVFDPSVDTAGTYTYIVAGGACADATSEVIVTIDVAPNAGTNGTADFCTTDATADLFTSLGGTPDTGGTWSPALTSGTGVFDPSVDTAGMYTYTVLGTGSCADATATITVTVDTAPNAGINGTVEFCTTDASADLFASLGGTPDTGGTWSPALASGTGVFDPSIDTAGTYTYTVNGTGVCANISATVDVTVYTAPNAGTNGTADFCTTDATADLFTSLGGTPDAGGTWSPALTSGTGVFDPAVDPAGTYTYTVTPTGTCPLNATADVVVTVVTAPESGTAVTPNLVLCNTDAALDLDTSLTGADAGGTWSDDDSTGGLTGNMFDPTGLATGTYDFTYTVAALGPCPQSQTTVSIEVTAAPNAGTAVAIADICDTETALDLTTGLTGQDSGGTWNDDDGTGGLTGNSFDATGVAAGTYNFTYTVAPTSPCAIADSQIVEVTVVRSPTAGTAVSPNLTLCNTDAALDLDTSLTGQDAGGTWADDDSTGGLTGNMFDPTGLATGSYDFTYTVAALGPCPQSQTTVSIEVTAAPNAGTAVAIADICDTETALDLTTGLTGQDAGGTWNDDDGTGGLTGNSFDATGVAAGTYNFTYTVAPTSPCAVADSETVQVTVVRSPTSGTAVTPNLAVCNTDAALDLDTSLTGADAGGTWSDDDSTGGLTGNMFDATGLASGTYDFTYTVAALGPCPQSQTTVSIEVTAAPNAGTAVAIADICDTDSVDLTTGLTGQDAGGTWNDDDGTGGLTGNTFDATGVAAGTYNFTYTVAPTSPCAVADSETVQVTVIRSPDAGINADDFFCMTDVSRDLFDTLGGTPDMGGTWSPALTSGTGVFNPAIDAAGVYTYTVSGSGACADATATVTVTLSEAPVISSIDVVDFSDNNTITITTQGIVSGTDFGIGDFEYSIDGVNFQSENVFENVAPGTYTVTVRDTNGCLPDAVITSGAVVMGAPKFFTPNNDGENDFWQIVNIQSQPDAQVSIYDRFGKLLTRFDGTSEGWNGFYNNESLPSTDYWFSVVMNDADGNPIVRRGNFSLIRR